MSGDKNKLGRHPDAAWRIIDGQAVIVTPDSGELHLMNETASFIWNLLESERAEGEVAEAIIREFDVPAEAAAEDARSFIEEMIVKKIIIML